MLSFDSLLGEIEQALQTRNAKAISKEIGIGENKLRRILNAAGFLYDTSSRIWTYKGPAGEKDTRLVSLRQYAGNTPAVPSERPLTKPKNTDIKKINTEEYKINTNIPMFTEKEIEALKSIARERLEGKAEKPVLTIQEEILRLDMRTTLKRTYVVSEDISERLNAFCEKNRVQKSDVLGVALLQLLEKYEG